MSSLAPDKEVDGMLLMTTGSPVISTERLALTLEIFLRVTLMDMMMILMPEHTCRPVYLSTRLPAHSSTCTLVYLSTRLPVHSSTCTRFYIVSFIRSLPSSFFNSWKLTAVCFLSNRVIGGDELDDVSGDGLADRRPQHAVVSVQKLHGLEVRRPDPHDDDRQRQARRPDDGVPGLIEVGDLAVGEDEEDRVLLQRDRHGGGVALRALGGDGGDVVDEGREVCGSGESQLRHHHPVGLDDPIDT
ncbi:hypothetical protein EYF80_049209 [Liparis tanakae]|uniref:Uncharacterized protein n=1 Tax=Liparis tanakae TaxID=230148 RepID=A0A4Z2FHH8_9TELE|nr:hypothetical protein EYF80_049209 [Liparis tanakae]